MALSWIPICHLSEMFTANYAEIKSSKELTDIKHPLVLTILYN